ncbi:hypothetical protein [Candidatus Vidania fulgoroideorum]
MRHRKLKKINKSSSHRLLMMKNMLISLLKIGYIRTTKRKARMLASFIFKKSHFNCKLRVIEDGTRKGDFSKMYFVYYFK